MSSFSYTARDLNGNAVNGTVTASSVEDATQILRREGKYVTSVQSAEQPSGAAPSAYKGIKISRADVIQLSTQLAIMVETGVTLSEALGCIASQSEKPKVKELVEDIARHVEAGGDMSTALARHERSFPRLFVALIRAAEKSGMLGKLLVRATNYLRDEQETLRRVKGALIYPAIMMAFALSTTVFLLAFVLPKFTAIYTSKAAALPLPTKILMNISNFLIDHSISLPIAVVMACIGAYSFSKTQPGTRAVAYLQLHVPLLGSMFKKLHLSRSIRMIGTMGGAGVPLIDCVTTAGDLCSNIYFRELWSDVLEKIQAGRQISEPLFDSPLVPRSVAQMIHSGEKSGKLSFVMDQVSMFAEQELKEKIAELTRYIEPLMIAMMGIIIGGVALALLLPIFTISRVVAS